MSLPVDGSPKETAQNDQKMLIHNISASRKQDGLIFKKIEKDVTGRSKTGREPVLSLWYGRRRFKEVKI